MDPRHRIAIFIESSSAFGRGLLAGIAAYAQTHGRWTFFYGERPMDSPLPRRLADWRPDGLLVRIANAGIARQVRRLGLPTVDLREELICPEVPFVAPDGEAIVRVAVDHLMERGLRFVAFVGFENVAFSETRRKHLLDYAGAKGIRAAVFQDKRFKPPQGSSRVSEESAAHSAALVRWLRTIDKPVGIVACNDMRAQQVLNACAECGVAVPDEAAVVGVDNDPLLCQLSNPPMSSVDPNAPKVGFEAAGLLDRMIAGQDSTPQSLLIEPAGIVVRRSTDFLAIPDASVTEAVRYVREHACEGLTLEDLVEELAVSRRTLIRWFMKHLGHSPSEEIARVRFDRAKQLLRTTNLALDEVARLAGFVATETMYRHFQRKFRQTPGAYRVEHRRIDVFAAEKPL